MKIILVILSICTLVFSQTFIKEYSYNASENDSKVTARKAALKQIKLLAIEEVGVVVKSSYSKNEFLSGENFSKTIKTNFSKFSSALTKTKILDQKWNGETFYIKGTSKNPSTPQREEKKMRFYKSFYES